MLDEKSLQDLKKEAEGAYKIAVMQRTQILNQIRNLQTQLNQVDAEIAKRSGEYDLLNKIFEVKPEVEKPKETKKVV